ncbi:MAG: DNA-processing protein DprA [Oscillospiraceae bacterium]|nr:DNA-processing protein DprA [Oscillospiraceae bacterium]
MGGDLYYIWLALACGAGSAAPQKLLGIFETAEKIYSAEKDELKEKCDLIDMEESIFDRLCNKDTADAEKILEFCAKNNVSVLNCDSKLYPKRLRSVRAFPVVLYYKGKLPDIDDNLCIAMVGTRKMTDYGKKTAYELARELASCGAIIVSGMAEGIDSASHKGCLIAGGFTVAVFGCGIDRVYPLENKNLMDKIIEKGLVMTEYPPGTEPKGFHFPVRNRIISGLSQAVLVVEADFRSGALITAKTALFQGRELYAVPGNINAHNSRGANSLLKDQAGIVTEAYDILSEYEHIYSHRINIENTWFYKNKSSYYENKESKENKKDRNYNKKIVNKLSDKIKSQNTGIKKEEDKINQENKPEVSLSEKLSALKIILNDTELRVFEAFHAKRNEKLHANDIETGMTISEVMNTLTFLELYGIITSLPGDYYKISDSFLSL